MSVTLENYTNIVGGSTLNKHFLFTSEGGFIGATTALASTADQIAAGNAFGSSAAPLVLQEKISQVLPITYRWIRVPKLFSR